MANYVYLISRSPPLPFNRTGMDSQQDKPEQAGLGTHSLHSLSEHRPPPSASVAKKPQLVERLGKRFSAVRTTTLGGHPDCNLGNGVKEAGGGGGGGGGAVNNGG